MTTAIERLRAALVDDGWQSEERLADAARALTEIEAGWESLRAEAAGERDRAEGYRRRLDAAEREQSQDIAAIRARTGPSLRPMQAFFDRAALLAEVDRLSIALATTRHNYETSPLYRVAGDVAEALGMAEAPIADVLARVRQMATAPLTEAEAQTWLDHLFGGTGAGSVGQGALCAALLAASRGEIPPEVRPWDPVGGRPAAPDPLAAAVAAQATREARPAAACTGATATWCPVHGDCVCPHLYDDPSGGRTLDAASCPLHALTSNHADGEADDGRITPADPGGTNDIEISAWPLRDVLAKLVEGADRLLDVHDHDGDGWEQIDAARKAARAYLAEWPGDMEQSLIPAHEAPEAPIADVLARVVVYFEQKCCTLPPGMA